MKKWSSQWTQFMQLRKEAWKKTSTRFEPVTSQLPVQCSTNWAMKPLTLGAGQLWVHMFPWKKWVLMIYEINRIWPAESFFQASLCNCINCVHCDDHFFIFTSHFDTNSSSEIAQKFVHFKFHLHVNSYSSFFKPSMWSYLHLDWINLYQKTTLNCWLPFNLHVLKTYL